MTLKFEEAREYMLTQPFVEDSQMSENLMFNPYVLPKEPTVLGSIESKLGEINSRSASESLREYPALKSLASGLFEWPEGTFTLYLSATMDDDLNFIDLEEVSVGLTSDSVFSELVDSGIHFTDREAFLGLCHELRLKQEIVNRLAKKYNLNMHIPNCDGGLVVDSKKFPDYKDINAVLDFCGAYHGVVNQPQFNEGLMRLNRKLNSSLDSLSESLILGE